MGMRFKIVDPRTGECILGLNAIPEDHAAFVTSRIAWERSPTALAVGEGMNGTFGREGYRAIRLEDGPVEEG